MMTRREYLLTTLIEEATETQHAAAKALHFGLFNEYEESGTTNAQTLTTEFTHVIAIMSMLEDEGHLVMNAKQELDTIKEKKAQIDQNLPPE